MTVYKDDSDKITKYYYENEKFKISLEGQKLKKIYSKSLTNNEKFWSEEANNLIWFKTWDQVLRWDPPFAKWFDGGLLNASVNCLDRHIQTSTKNKAAIIWEGEDGSSKTLTYYQLYKEVNRFSNALKELGLKKGDTVTIYLPVIPELIISMLSCSRLGIIHNVVFSGFSSKSLSDRLNDSCSKAIITADGGFRRGKIIELKKIVDEALTNNSTVTSIIIVKRIGNEIPLKPNNYWWHDIVKQKSYCEPVEIESTHPLFILYTSGTTGKPKGVLHSTGGYLTYLYSTAKWVFNFDDKDIFYCTADIGWVTGHSYIVYAPLLHGITEIIYEGAPDYPKPDRYWAIVEKYGATILYTTPTALRMYMKYGDSYPNSYDLSSLRLLGTVGEPINPEVWKWYYHTIGKQNCYIVDTWWQTETGGILLGACTGIDPVSMKPGSATFPLPGIEVDIVDEKGNPKQPNDKGYLIIKRPWPGMMLTLWNDDTKYINTYWKKFPNYYFPGDYAMKDSDSYYWLLGRADDILKVAGHRLGTMELESAFISHKSIVEAAVTGKVNDTKGESIIAFLVLKEGYSSSNSLIHDLKNHIRDSIGPIATPDQIIFVNKLPKTRSGKIMRRLLKCVANGIEIGDATTLEDEATVDEIVNAYNEIKNLI